MTLRGRTTPGLQDRGIVTNGVYVNQGGEDVTFSGRHDFSVRARGWWRMRSI